jgi:pathogenesis-related protein 1
MVTAHNYWRSQVGQPPLRWSQTLGNHAQDWADTLAERGALEHQLKDHYGENLALFRGRSPDPREVVEYWASEQHHYDERSNICRGECRHYTQIVWGTTKEVGCGQAERNGTTYWVCNYLPAGNAHGVRPY